MEAFGYRVKRPRQHVMEEESERLFKSFLPPEWIVRKIEKDYGVDYEVEIVDQQVVTGNRIWIQLKSADTPLVRHAAAGNAREHVTYPIKVKDLLYAESCPFPLLLCVADLKSTELFWTPVRHEIKASLDRERPEWRTQETATLRLALENTLSLEKTTDYSRLRWFALEPPRLSALSLVMHYYHEFKSMTLPGLHYTLLEESGHGVHDDPTRAHGAVLAA